MKQRPLAALLTLCLVIGLLPLGAAAAEPAVTADDATLTTWDVTFGGDTLSTKDIGRIWTDKTVSAEEGITLQGDVGENGLTIQKEKDAEYQVVLSALGSAATIVDQTSVPTDTMLILDMSPNMQAYDTEMVEAANTALENLLTANPDNRVGVVVYDNTAMVLLPLDHYNNYSGGQSIDLLSLSGKTVTSNGILDTSTVKHEFAFDSGAYRNYQLGMLTGMDQLANAQDTTVTITQADGQEKEVSRVPVVISMASGNPSLGQERIVGTPEEVGSSTRIEPKVSSTLSPSYYIAQAFTSLLTAGYMKQEIQAHYSTKEEQQNAYIYTVGVGSLSNGSNASIANVVLDPKENLTESTTIGAENVSVKGALDSYNNNGSVELTRGKAVLTRSVTISRSNNPTLTLEDLQYNDGYYAAQDVSTTEAWEEIFQEIADEISTVTPTYPTQTGEGTEGGDSGELVFTDQLGQYMKVTGTPTVVFAEQKFRADGSSKDGNTTTYTFSGEVDTPVYGQTNVSELTLTVTTQENGSQTLTWTIPPQLLPLRSVTAKTEANGSSQKTYTIQETENSSAYPIRLFYSVAKDDGHQWSQADNDYLLSHSKNGTTNYYAGAWDSAASDESRYGTATAVFTPAAGNSFYHYTQDTVLYTLVNQSSGSNRYLSEEDAKKNNKTLIDSGTTQVTVGNVVYSLAPASEYVEGRAYYYAHTYYQATGQSDQAQVLTDHYMVEDGSRIQVGANAAVENGTLYLKAGVNKLSRVSDGVVDKENNPTNTAATSRYPVYTTEDNTVTVHLGNNGLLTEDTPTGSLTVTVGKTTVANGQDLPNDAANAEFIYTLELFNSSDFSSLNGTYPITISSDDTSATIQTGGTFPLKAGQTATVSGLPAGTAYRLTETGLAGYTPSYTGGTESQAGNTGQILYRQTGQSPYAAVTVTHTYDPSGTYYNVTYLGNALENGTVGSVPPGGGVTGGTYPLSTQVPTLTFSGTDKKAVFIGWSETKSTEIFGVEDKSGYAGWSTENPVYASGASFDLTNHTTFYAVWGWDTDADGAADVTETTYTLTYNANDGTFSNQQEIKTVTVVAQTGYPLLTDKDELPTHAKGAWNSQETDVVFMGWSATEIDTIFSVNDAYPTGKILSTADISGNTTVYAVWGYDSNGDGTADIDNETHQIILSWGEGGTATAEYSSQTDVTATDAGGSQTWYVVDGESLTVKITPEQGYAVDTIKVDSHTFHNRAGSSTPNGSGYSSASFTEIRFDQVTANHTVAITFAESKNGTIPDKNDRTLTFHANGGTNAPSPLTGLYDGQSCSLSELSEPTHEKADETAVLFLGWLTTDNNEAIYGAGDSGILSDLITDSVVIQGDMDLYAAWGYDQDGDSIPDVMEATVTYKANGGTGDDQIFSYSEEETVTIHENLWFTRSNYTFDGWNTEADGSGTDYAPADPVADLTGSLVLFAQWTYSGGGSGGSSSKRYTLRYDTNGGEELSSESKSRAWTKDYADLPTPVRAGYQFAGWYLDSALTEPVEEDVAVGSTTVTLYAKWTQDLSDPDNTGVSDWLDTQNHAAYLFGYGDGTFGPERSMTRAEAAQAFYRLLLDQTVPSDALFTDVPSDAWYADAVNTLGNLGILTGVGDGKFDPDRTITRAEFTAIAMRFAQAEIQGENTFSDVEETDWFYPCVTGAVQYGWLSGYADGTFRPQAEITRAEVAVIVNNMLGRTADETYIDAHPDALTSFPDVTASHWGYYTIMEAVNTHQHETNNGTETWTGLS